MAGRKPIPVDLIDNAKDRKTKEQLEARKAAEITGCTAKLSPPRELSARAKKEWRRIVKLYRGLETEILNDLDVGILRSYCESMAIYIEAEEEYQNHGLVMQKDGRILENPYLKIMRLEGANIAKYAEQLCLSPVGRARMGVAAAKKIEDADPMGALLNGGRD